MNKKNTMKQKTSKKSKLEKDLEEKPKITLNPLERTVVHTPTQEKYNTLMQVYECGGWTWVSGDLPTRGNQWIYYGEKTCIGVESRFGYSREEFYQREGRKIISIQEFHNMQKITPENIKEINKWFKKYSK